MSEKTIVTDQAGEEDSNESIRLKHQAEGSRRDFLQKAIAAGSGLAIYSMVPALARESWIAQQPNCDPAAGGQTLQSIMEIKSAGAGSTKTLKAVIKVLDEEKVYLGSPRTGQTGPSCNTGRMRYFSGYDASLPPLGRPVWPKTHGVPGPGPTLRAGIGDTVQITLLNHVNVKNFPNTLDVAEHGQACDQATTFGQGNTYPGTVPTKANPTPSTPFFENPPNCFHGSSSTNLHFHGTHVSPSGISDNVLLNIRPSPRDRLGLPVVNEKTVGPIFDKIFANCMHGHQPLLWTDWPPEWQKWQKQLLIQYDNTATWLGKSPPPGGNGPSVLPQDEQLWFQNEQEMKPPHPQLPQYYIGAFPNCFTIPEWNGKPNSMGQAPGTHWYHAHKHGSTALNLANGMAGALIIEGDYDTTLHEYYKSKAQPLEEKVLVLQQFSAVLGLLRAQGKADFVSVNGQYQPVLEMKPNQTQMWRFINACHQAPVPLNTSPDLKWVQTAQDGVQLHQDNYNPNPFSAAIPSSIVNTISVPAKTFFIGGKWISNGSLAPGNRVDLLVRAPSSGGPFPVTYHDPVLNKDVVLFMVKLTGSAVSATDFPSNADFPKQPLFLKDIVPPVGMVKREFRFNTAKSQFGQFASPSPTPTPIGSTGGRNSPTPSPTPPLMPNAPPMHTINGKQFSGEIDEYMKLSATEEWTLANDTPTNGPAHPFHIHINPFQIVEWFDPALNLPPQGVKMGHPWVWWDNFAIPTGGWVKMLTRFVDYTGTYVFHCHILGHEDRGMMELVNVSPSGTPMKHK
jgi:FtsP/CotA-like multicopper oxidase with cupredoxin domain